MQIDQISKICSLTFYAIFHQFSCLFKGLTSMRINGLSGRASQLPSDKLVSQGFKQFRLRLARGVSKLVVTMEICEIVMESIGKQHQPIAGFEASGGSAVGAVRQCMVRRVDGCRHWQWSRSSSGVPVAGRRPLPAPAAVQHPSYLVTLHRQDIGGGGW